MGNSNPLMFQHSDMLQSIDGRACSVGGLRHLFDVLFLLLCRLSSRLQHGTVCAIAQASAQGYVSCPSHLLTPPELTKNPVEGFSAGLADDNNLYEWEVMIIGPPETLYEGGFFKTRLSFPKDYPQVCSCVRH
jgi:hypothetical protein